MAGESKNFDRKKEGEREIYSIKYNYSDCPRFGCAYGVHIFQITERVSRPDHELTLKGGRRKKLIE